MCLYENLDAQRPLILLNGIDIAQTSVLGAYLGPREAALALASTVVLLGRVFRPTRATTRGQGRAGPARASLMRASSYYR